MAASCKFCVEVFVKVNNSMAASCKFCVEVFVKVWLIMFALEFSNTGCVPHGHMIIVYSRVMFTCRLKCSLNTSQCLTSTGTSFWLVN